MVIIEIDDEDEDDVDGEEEDDRDAAADDDKASHAYNITSSSCTLLVVQS